MNSRFNIVWLVLELSFLINKNTTSFDMQGTKANAAHKEKGRLGNSENINKRT